MVKSSISRKDITRHEVFIVDFNALLYLDNFLISAITSIILIRIYLIMTGFPQVGGAALHISHMLWGGLLMMATLISLLAFINRNAKIIGSIVGGVGFGIFIDELGKFITHNNDYFFQPTFALLYILFILIYLFFRKLFQVVRKDDKEFIMNALELLKEAVFFDLDTNEKDKLMHYLKKSDPSHPLVKEMSHLFEKLEANPVNNNTTYLKLKRYLRKKYLHTIQSDNFLVIVFGLFTAGSITNIVFAVNKLVSGFLDFWSLGLIISVAVSVAFTLWGLLQLMRKKTLLAELYLLRSAMVSIFFIQFFVFYYHQFLAFIPLLTAFVTYASIQSLLEVRHTNVSA